MRETILPKISGTACDGAPHAHTHAREPTASLLLLFFVCRVGIACLSIFIYISFSLSLFLSLSRMHTPRSSVESPRYRGYTVGDVAEPVREGGALVTSPYRHFASWRQPRAIGLPAAYLTALCFHTGFLSFRKPATEQDCQLVFSGFEIWWNFTMIIYRLF